MNVQEGIIYKRLAHIIKEGDVGLFFGAGMSREAGIPVVSTIVSNIVSLRWRCLKYMQKG